ncbi:hypothetical protein MHW47_08600 [Streptomyces sp. OfavH-34-F]|uniref:hypothetical protein n=1 Tax=Streptomyces sp. OfavH-34-F TaxID=2917760 RepID=UPI001EF1ECDD|nr:hypothetical protein [Streptomyces sp. OfavH-34-F]MCG7524493.1 hypothetical protein [Streptomyces sp. OfavH-34-F]
MLLPVACPTVITQAARIDTQRGGGVEVIDQQEEHMSTVTEAGVRLEELGRFFAITARRFDAGQSAPEMFSTAIDAAWHRLAQDPQAHRAFTTEHAGRELIHAETSGHGPIAWVGAYEESYGPLPEVWFTTADGSLDIGALSAYRETGRVVAEWNCSPAPSDGDR